MTGYSQHTLLFVDNFLSLVSLSEVILKASVPLNLAFLLITRLRKKLGRRKPLVTE